MSTRKNSDRIKDVATYAVPTAVALQGFQAGMFALEAPSVLAGSAASRYLHKFRNPSHTVQSQKSVYDKLRKSMRPSGALKTFYGDGPLGSNSYYARNSLGTKGISTHINIAKNSQPATIAHELGHASGLGRSRLYKRILEASMNPKLGKASIATAVLAPTGSSAETLGVAGFAFSKGGLLAEEARASVRGLRHTKKVGIKVPGSKRGLAAAFGTYVAHAALPAAALTGALMLKKKTTSNMNKSRNTKASAWLSRFDKP
jgi:hypothetical protein